VSWGQFGTIRQCRQLASGALFPCKSIHKSHSQGEAPTPYLLFPEGAGVPGQKVHRDSLRGCGKRACTSADQQQTQPICRWSAVPVGQPEQVLTSGVWSLHWLVVPALTPRCSLLPLPRGSLCAISRRAGRLRRTFGGRWRACWSCAAPTPWCSCTKRWRTKR